MIPIQDDGSNQYKASEESFVFARDLRNSEANIRRAKNVDGSRLAICGKE